MGSLMTGAWTLLKYGSQDGREYTEAAPPTEMEIMAGDDSEYGPRNCPECKVELQRGASRTDSTMAPVGNESRDQPGKCINCAGDDSMAKALPEQQMFSNPTQARTYGDSDYGEQERMGTVHPAIQGMLNRRGQYSMEVDRATPYQQTQYRMGLPPTHIQDVESYYEDEPQTQRPLKNSSQRALDDLHADPDVEATDENLRMYAENPMRGARNKGNVGGRMMPPNDYFPEGYRSPARYSENSAPYTAEDMEEYMAPMAKAWGTLKALPEQQQYTDLPGLGGGFEQQTPQHRVGTVHPSIRQMLQRLQGRRASELYNFDYSGHPAIDPDLRTTDTAPHHGNPGVRNMIESHPGRRGMPSQYHELHGTEYGQSPQFMAEVPGVYAGDPRMNPVRGSLESNTADTVKPPAGSSQAMIDELHASNPDATARAFDTQQTPTSPDRAAWEEFARRAAFPQG